MLRLSLLREGGFGVGSAIHRGVSLLPFICAGQRLCVAITSAIYPSPSPPSLRDLLVERISPFPAYPLCPSYCQFRSGALSSFVTAQLSKVEPQCQRMTPARLKLVSNLPLSAAGSRLLGRCPSNSPWRRRRNPTHVQSDLYPRTAVSGSVGAGSTLVRITSRRRKG